MNQNRTNLPRALNRRRVFPSREIGQLALSLAGLSVLVLLPACSSTHIQSARLSAVPSAAPVHNVLVVGMDQRADLRAQLEADVVLFLQQRKVAGIVSHDRFALSDFKGDKETIRQKCASTGADSVLLVRTTGRTTVTDFREGGLGSLDAGQGGELGYELFTANGGFKTDVRLEAKLFRVSDAAPIWNAVLDTILKDDSYDSRAVMSGIAQAIVTNLAKDKLIP
jgi:hypothetical protein